jgi:hypothetical protein
MRAHHNNKKDQMLPVRQWLNIIFMIGAIVGVCIYFFANQTTGTIVILVAMIFKMVECALRFLR